MAHTHTHGELRQPTITPSEAAEYLEEHRVIPAVEEAINEARAVQEAARAGRRAILPRVAAHKLSVEWLAALQRANNHKLAYSTQAYTL